MSFSASRRKVAALAVASAGLAVVLSGAFASAASAAPAAPVATGVSAAKSDWFVDPRTPAQRRAQVAVPKSAKGYRGKVVETRAVYRTRAGALAVPMRFAFGHSMVKGQATTLDGDGLFAVNRTTLTASAKTQIRRLATALQDASSVRCEGYADYAGTAARNNVLARERAARVCDFLVSVNEGLVATTLGYGPTRPAVIGGRSEDRRLNRRVVVEMTGTRPVVPVAPQAKVPGAPVLQEANGYEEAVYYAWTPPATDGGSAITGYEVSTGGGWAPVDMQLGRRVSTLCRGCGDEGYLYASLRDLVAGSTVDLRVRAVNAVGAGAPSNTLSTPIYGLPDAPTAVTAAVEAGTATVTFAAPTATGGLPLAGYQVRVDDGVWEPVTLEPSLSPLGFRLTDQAVGTHTYAIRASNAYGYSEAATSNEVEVVEPQPNPPVFLGGWTWSGHYEVSFQDGEWNGVPWTGYELSVNNGPWLPLTVTYGGPSGYVATAEDPGCASTGGSCGSTTGRLRVVTATGASVPSNVASIYLD